MKIALIAKNDPLKTGYRVAEIFDTQPWEPAPDHIFVECDDTITAEAFWFDPETNSFVEIIIE
jgi:hypothetical protein